MRYAVGIEVHDYGDLYEDRYQSSQGKYLVYGDGEDLWTNDIDEALSFLKQLIENRE